jgi:alpha-tubulin suppressor-like RCC1 family protein
MRTRLVDIAVAALATITLAACTDSHRDFLAPRAPEKLLLSPQPIILNPGDFLEIAAGNGYTCARQRGGDVYCWGVGSATPTKVFSGATHIAVGDRHACALTSTGAASCWGMDTQGQVGWSQSYADYFVPVSPVLGPVDKNNPYGPLLPALTFSSIAAGGNSTCGTTSSGVFCWGDMGGMPSLFSSPTAVPALITNPNGFAYAGFSSLAVGANHACGFVSGTVDCWGSNAQFQAGVDTASHFAFIPIPATGLPSNIVIFAMGNQLGNTVSRVSAAGALTCADMANKTVECFGNNDNGQLGSGPGASTFVPQVIGGSMSLHGVAAGSLHACALDPNNLAMCWGDDSRGELGNGKPVGTFTTVQPVAVVSINMVMGTFSTTPMTFRALASGAEHTCGIGTDNHIYCWGDNQVNQLGRLVFDRLGNVASFTVNPVQTM